MSRAQGGTRRARRGSSSRAWSRSWSCWRAAAAAVELRRRQLGGGGGEELQKLGKGEGEVNLISWAGYVEAAAETPTG